MIYVLLQSMDNYQTYYIHEFETQDEAVKYIKSSNYYLDNFRILEGKELELTLKIKEVQNEQ